MTCSSSLNGMGSEWDRLHTLCAIDTVFMTPQWQHVWWTELGDRAQLWILRLSDDDGIHGIAPLTVDNGTVTFVGGHDVCDYNDFLVAQGKETIFYRTFLDYMAQREWSIVNLFSLPEESPTLVYLPEMARALGYNVKIEKDDVSPGVYLPDSWDIYLASLSKKDRHELRRKFRRLDSVDKMHWYIRSKENDILRDMGDFLELLRLSRPDKYRFLTPERERFFYRIVKEMSAMGAARLGFMEIDGNRVASALCFDYGSSRLLYNSGYNPAYGYYSVGLLLNALCLKDAIEDGKEYFDFLRGDEPYKYDLGAKDRVLYRMVVTKP